ncbi:Aste57867_18905 [Aphanomyces stellatus]|uniref:Aste57867_18905 protein n=1 Tax=Aphanomyces stellatus TaxID=120398 RepID=A0A485LFJ4_9STRA|nr:hypothetical protein As57867_018841 [Aphanomyces stellatus]VFT95637.1 Aste57867_18905 [Aphanomyces stellatus]
MNDPIKVECSMLPSTLLHAVACPSRGAEDSKQHQRRLTREKMRRYRHGLALKAMSLKEDARVLEREKRRLLVEQSQSPWLLSWEDIARAMQDDASVSRRANTDLKALFHEQRHLILSMRSWVERCLVLPDSSWRNVTLLADPTARQHGFDWITRHLHHNTDWVFHQYAFPPTASPLRVQDAFVDTSNPDLLQFVWRDQQQLKVPFDDACDAISLDFFHAMLPHGAASVTSAVDQSAVDADLLRALGRDTCRYSTSAGPNEPLNHVYRVFRSDARCIFVAQNIHDDQLLESRKSTRRLRNRMTWMVLDKVDVDTTTMRTLTMASQSFGLSGTPLSLDEEAAVWGISLENGDGSLRYDDEAKQRRFIRAVTERCKSAGVEYDNILVRIGRHLNHGNPS